MPSSNAKGNHYKQRTKKWLEERGYSVGFLERAMLVPVGKGRFIPRKFDQFGADLLAVDAASVLFVQVKLVATKRGDRRGDVPEATRIFLGFPCPTGAEQWIVLWTRGAREPEIVRVDRTAVLDSASTSTRGSDDRTD